MTSEPRRICGLKPVTRDMEVEVEEDSCPLERSSAAGEDSERLRAALRQKEQQVRLAAQLGNALLLENRQLKEERQTDCDRYTEQLEELQQGRYELQVKLNSCQVHWGGQVAELERDVQELQTQVDRLTQSLCEAEKDKTRLKHEHKEEIHSLREQLQRAMEVEQTMSSKLSRLKDELRDRGHSRPQDEEVISALREQVARLVQREQALEQRLKTVCEENEELRESVSSLHTHLHLQEQQCQTHTQQLSQAWREVEGLQSRVEELQSRVEELQQDVSLQENLHSDTSLLSELENSLEPMGWCQDNEQVFQEVSCILQLLRPAAHSSDDSLQDMLGKLRHAAHRIAHSETLQEMRKPIVGEVSDPCENSVQLQQLQDQNERLKAENTQVKLQNTQQEEVLQQALKDRDDAIAKKTAMETELLRTKHDMMCLNNQLLEAIQRKLQLSQELEAWQDDIQIIINQQLKTQQQTEQLQKSSTGRLSFLRKSRRVGLSEAGPQQSHSHSEAGPQQSHSHWRDWLRLRK